RDHEHPAWKFVCGFAARNLLQTIERIVSAAQQSEAPAYASAALPNAFPPSFHHPLPFILAAWPSAFVFQPTAIARQPTAIAGKGGIAADDPVAGHHDADGIRTICQPHCTYCRRLTNSGGEPQITERLPCGNRA